MVELIENAEWEEEIQGISIDEPLCGGQNGPLNRAIKQLGNRTLSLKQEVDVIKGLSPGGYLDAYDFESTIPDQGALTNYALSQIGGNDPLKIWNGTRVKNLFDNNVWILTNTPDTEPPIFEWSNNGPEIAVLTLAVTYEELLALIAEEKLIPGQKYLITDFQTVYVQPVSLEVMSGDVEPLMVTALSANKLEPIAFSPSNPGDVIFYDVTQNNTAMFVWATENDKGQIYRRITKNNNDIPYDVRAIKFRRWAFDFSTIPAYSATTTYALGDRVIYNGWVVISTSQDNVGITPAMSTGDGQNNSFWKKLCPTAGQGRFIVPHETVDGDNKGFLITLNTTSVYVPVNQTDYHDFWTFHKPDDTNYVDDQFCFSNLIAGCKNPDSRLNNSVFLGNHIHTNTIGGLFQNNTILGVFRNNQLGDNFEDNFINREWYDNVVGRGFKNNIVGGFVNNQILAEAAFNIFGETNGYNVIGPRFQGNIAAYNFYNNVVGVSCQNNTFATNCGSNTFGNNFSNNNFVVNTGNCNFYNKTFENGISKVKKWSTAGMSILQLGNSVTFRAVAGTDMVAYIYQDSAGTIQTGVV